MTVLLTKKDISQSDRYGYLLKRFANQYTAIFIHILHYKHRLETLKPKKLKSCHIFENFN